MTPIQWAYHWPAHEEDADYAVVGPTDGRLHISDTRRFPYNTICHLGRDFGNGKLQGCTGVLIDPRTVLTAAHCVYNRRRQRAPMVIWVVPGRSDRFNQPYGRFQSQCYFAPDHFIRNLTTRAHDYAVIKLSRAVKGIPKYMPLQALKLAELDTVLKRGRISIAGYPGDRPLGTLWRHSERLKSYSPRRLFYSVDTCPGHSGSPIWHRCHKRQRLEIIGVHTSGVIDRFGRKFGCARVSVMAPGDAVNSGVRITPTILKRVADPQSTTATSVMVRLP